MFSYNEVVVQSVHFNIKQTLLYFDVLKFAVLPDSRLGSSNLQWGQLTVITQINVVAFIKFLALKVRRLLEGGVYCKGCSNNCM